MQGPVLFNPAASSIIPALSSPRPSPCRIKMQQQRLGTCRGSSHHYSPITDFNLYELLGIDASSDTSQIKVAYRALQKRCHPDIAGPPGHDMAIFLNDAYALLSDPTSRMAYDKELAKVADLQGYTGRPIYSAWVGSESEERAVFVDEVKCIGCLKCALFADKTFAIESVYGRARVVAQWADPESNIQQAIAACPVDCILIVERSDLAALEFVMSKQPRGRVRIGAGNTAGIRTVDVFDEVEKFKGRYANHNAPKNYSKESEAGYRGIQMLSNWLYWESPRRDGTSALITQKWKGGERRRYDEASVKKLKEAAAGGGGKTSSAAAAACSEYWEPLAIALPTTCTVTLPTPNPAKAKSESDDESPGPGAAGPIIKGSPLRWSVPMGASIVAATIVRLQLGDPVGGGLEDHVGGSLALAIVNSSWMPLILAALTWYLILMYLVELLEAAFRTKL
ncbi:hypothetical protein ACS0TY_013598 [Phlomoides rotata]